MGCSGYELMARPNGRGRLASISLKAPGGVASPPAALSRGLKSPRKARAGTRAACLSAAQTSRSWQGPSRPAGLGQAGASGRGDAHVGPLDAAECADTSASCSATAASEGNRGHEATALHRRAVREREEAGRQPEHAGARVVLEVLLDATLAVRRLAEQHRAPVAIERAGDHLRRARRRAVHEDGKRSLEAVGIDALAWSTPRPGDHRGAAGTRERRGGSIDSALVAPSIEPPALPRRSSKNPFGRPIRGERAEHLEPGARRDRRATNGHVDDRGVRAPVGHEIDVELAVVEVAERVVGSPFSSAAAFDRRASAALRLPAVGRRALAGWRARPGRVVALATAARLARKLSPVVGMPSTASTRSSTASGGTG